MKTLNSRSLPSKVSSQWNSEVSCFLQEIFKVVNISRYKALMP